MDNYFDSKIDLMLQHGLNLSCAAFIRLQFISGARISDLLNIKRSDVLSNGTIIIRQGKGSNTLIINISQDFEFWELYRQGYYVEISCFSYSFFYKLYKRYGLIIFNEPGHNASVTHSPRKILAQTIYDSTNDIQIAASALGHRSTKSTEYYLTREQKKSNYKNGILGKVPSELYNFKARKTKTGDFINLK